MGMRSTVSEAINAWAQRTAERGWPRLAVAGYRLAAAIRPDWSAPWYNIGLHYKQARHWRKSAAFNLRATRCSKCSAAAYWNLGIAATALGDWPMARSAWRGYGIELDDDEGPISMRLGLTPIRVSPDGNAEVVWCDRIDPARAVIRNVPTPDSGRGYGDLVLHDGEPRGYRKLGEREVSVFDEIEVLESSAFSTFRADIARASRVQISALEARFTDAGLMAENWSTDMHIICKACSEGRPSDSPDHQHDVKADPEVWRIAIAALSEQEVRTQLEAWMTSAGGAELVSFARVREAALASGRG